MFREDLRRGAVKEAFLLSDLFPGEELARRRAADWQAFWTPARVADLQRELTRVGRGLGFAPDAFAPFVALLTGPPPAAAARPGGPDGLPRDRGGTILGGSGSYGDAGAGLRRERLFCTLFRSRPGEPLRRGALQPAAGGDPHFDLQRDRRHHGDRDRSRRLPLFSRMAALAYRSGAGGLRPREHPGDPEAPGPPGRHPGDHALDRHHGDGDRLRDLLHLLVPAVSRRAPSLDGADPPGDVPGGGDDPHRLRRSGHGQARGPQEHRHDVAIWGSPIRSSGPF